MWVGEGEGEEDEVGPGVGVAWLSDCGGEAFPYSSSTSTFLLSSMGEDDEDGGGGGVDVDGLLLRMEASEAVFLTAFVK